ncbi:hypothetical protein M407DRAFT_129643 [Tulasnella calospora MUT 4182]|uniref:Uncharacterized protein n=1 Tax=Tulasnella calospora MUT 4182 TaxID=1051891 RepID=A0A0C3LIP2_9AGAM|nr:hypothetical protein M407DRAFT_129643 [Tulasnella calospora MUT 4182]
MSKQFVHAHDSSRGHEDKIWALQWTTAEQCLSAGADGKLLLWDTTKANGAPVRQLQQHPLALISLSGNTEGTRVLSNSIEGTTSLYDVQTGELLGKHESFERRAGITAEPAWSVSLNPNGATYAASNGSGSVTIHSTEKESFGKLVQTLLSGRSKFGLSVAHSPDAKRIALSSETGAIYIFDVESATLIATFSSHAMSVRALAWSPDSQVCSPHTLSCLRI